MGLSELPSAVPAEAKKLTGKTVVAAGTLHELSRSKVDDFIHRLRVKAASGVSQRTDYVVAGEYPGNKLDKARRLGVKILDSRRKEVLALAGHWLPLTTIP